MGLILNYIYIVLQSEVSYAGWVQKKRLNTKKKCFEKFTRQTI